MKTPIVRLGLILTLLCSTPVAAEIYKIVDARGNVSYTDKPPRDLANGTTAVTMNVKLHNSYQAPKKVRQADPNEDEPAIPGSDIYSDLAITSPTPGISLRSNSGSLTISARLTPTLRPGHKLEFFLDGRSLGTVNGTSVAVNDVPRGQHSVNAQIVDIEGRPLRDSETVQFTVQRYAPGLAPNAPRPTTGDGNTTAAR